VASLRKVSARHARPHLRVTLLVTGLRGWECEHMPVRRACECTASPVWGCVYAPYSCVLPSLGISVHLRLCGGLGGSGRYVWLWVTFIRAPLSQSCECGEAGVTL